MADKIKYTSSALIVVLSLLCEVEARTRIFVPIVTSTLSVGIIIAIVVSALVFLCILGALCVKCLSSSSRSGRVIDPHPPSMLVLQGQLHGQTVGYSNGGMNQLNKYHGNAKVPEPPPYSQSSASPPAYSPPAYSPPAYLDPAYSPPAYLDPAYPPVNARAPSSTFGQSIAPPGTPLPRNLAMTSSSSRSLDPPGTSASQRPISGASAPVTPSASGVVPSAPVNNAPPGTAASNRPQSVAPPKEGFASISSPWS